MGEKTIKRCANQSFLSDAKNRIIFCEEKLEIWEIYNFSRIQKIYYLTYFCFCWKKNSEKPYLCKNKKSFISILWETYINSTTFTHTRSLWLDIVFVMLPIVRKQRIQAKSVISQNYTRAIYIYIYRDAVFTRFRAKLISRDKKKDALSRARVISSVFHEALISHQDVIRAPYDLLHTRQHAHAHNRYLREQLFIAWLRDTHAALRARPTCFFWLIIFILFLSWHFLDRTRTASN